MFTRSFMIALLCFLVGTETRGVQGAEPGSDEVGRKAEVSFKNHAPLAAQIVGSDRVVLYEGLPHQLLERELLEQEVMAKRTTDHHGFSFYVEPLQLKEADAAALKKLLADVKSFRAFRGPKPCGGFHPDYCVEYHGREGVVHCLFCFGCGELKIFGPDLNLYCNIEDMALEKFKALLGTYRKQRPK